MNIKILGPGCFNCKRLAGLVYEVLEEMGTEATIEKVTAYPEILKYDILGTPGLVVDGKVVCSGRVPRKVEIQAWLKAAKES